MEASSGSAGQATDRVRSDDEVRQCRLLRTGLQLSRQTSWDRWVSIGSQIFAHADASSWWLGDWLVFGETHFARRYATAIESTGLGYKTLRNYAVVARRYPMSRRRDNLSFAHHAEVCALDDPTQEAWLDLAEANGWSKAELRRRVRSHCSDADGTGVTAVLRLRISAELDDRWRRAAASADCELHEWVVRTLDVAAERAP